MNKDKYLKISTKKVFTANQGVSLPLAVILSSDNLKNWYYLNYMLPVSKFEGLNNLTCDIIDAYTYGAMANTYGRIIRYSNISSSFLQEIEQIVRVIKREINEECYVTLFVDFFHIKCSDHYHKEHFIHEIMFYGYDNRAKKFVCIGFLHKPMETFEVSYEEINIAFHDAKEKIYTTNGWDRHMCITLQLVGHKEIYPYDNGVFWGNLSRYIELKIPQSYYYEQLIYSNSTDKIYTAFGIEITKVFLKYVSYIKEKMKKGEDLKEIRPQYHSFCMYKEFHQGLLERIKYFAKMNSLENTLEIYINKYIEIVNNCNYLLMQYVKFFILIKKHGKWDKKVIEKMIILLNKIYEDEIKVIQNILKVWKKE